MDQAVKNNHCCSLLLFSLTYDFRTQTYFALFFEHPVPDTGNLTMYLLFLEYVGKDKCFVPFFTILFCV